MEYSCSVWSTVGKYGTLFAIQVPYTLRTRSETLTRVVPNRRSCLSQIPLTLFIAQPLRDCLRICMEYSCSVWSTVGKYGTLFAIQVPYTLRTRSETLTRVVPNRRSTTPRWRTW